MRHILMRDTRVENLENVSNQKIRIIPITAMQTWWRAADTPP